MNARHLLGVALLLCLSSHTIAQNCTPHPVGSGMQLLCGSRHAGPGAVTASTSAFGVGLTKDNGATYTNTATVSEIVKIEGQVRPEAADIGLTGDIFVVDYVLGSSAPFTMKTPDGIWVPWNGVVANLVPYLEDEPLSAAVSVDLYTGVLGTPNEHRFFLGYLPPDGTLRYHTTGLPVTVTAAQNPSAQAEALFEAKINPNIVQPICTACHIDGGTGSPQHVFVFGTNASAVEFNYGVMVGLEATWGKTHLMNQLTTNNTSHPGSRVIFSASDIADLDQFLTLLGQF